MEIPRVTPWKIAENRTLKWDSSPPQHKLLIVSDLSTDYTAFHDGNTGSNPVRVALRCYTFITIHLRISAEVDFGFLLTLMLIRPWKSTASALLPWLVSSLESLRNADPIGLRASTPKSNLKSMPSRPSRVLVTEWFWPPSVTGRFFRPHRRKSRACRPAPAEAFQHSGNFATKAQTPYDPLPARRHLVFTNKPSW